MNVFERLKIAINGNPQEVSASRFSGKMGAQERASKVHDIATEQVGDTIARMRKIANQTQQLLDKGAH